jgi:uncharacterized RDD family membrane protein YckC
MNVTPPRGIVTPEAVVLEFDTAGLGSRVVAIVIDLLVQGAVLVMMVFALGLAADGGAGTTLVVVLSVVFLFLILLGYPVAFETLWNGRTLGKAAMGLRVVTREGAPIRFRHAAIRGIFGLIELWAFFGSIAVATVLVTRRNQRLGDLAAGTIVLIERTAGGHTNAVFFRPPPGYEAYVAALDVSALDAERYAVVRSFLVRAGGLAAPSRAALAVGLANRTATTMRHTPPPGVPPELFLTCAAAAYQQRRGGLAGRPPPPAPPPPAPPAPTSGW